MSHAPRRADDQARSRTERIPRQAAALLTALLHALLLLWAWWSRPVPISSAQSAGGGSGALAVTYIEDVAPPPARRPTPPRRAKDPPAKAPPASTRLQSTRVVRADDPVPAVADAGVDSPPTPPAQPPPDVPEPSPPDSPEPAEDTVPPVADTPPTQRPARMKGLPPGMRLEDLAPARGQPGRGPPASQGRDSGAGTSGASLGVDGYQVFYELVYETRLRAWREQGMTELFLPLPGTRRLMVCPLETALRRGSGPCRMVEPDAPELKAIGDARDVIFMQRVYRLGEEVWSGPGPYR